MADSGHLRSGIIQHVIFCDSLLSLHICSRLTYVLCQYILVLHSFLQLNNIPLCGYTFVYLSLVDGHVGWFTVLYLCMPVFSKHVPLLWLQWISTRELLHWMATLFLKVKLSLYTPPSSVWGCQCLTSSLKLVIVSFFFFFIKAYLLVSPYAEAETPILWPPHGKSWLIGKDPDAGRDWGQEEKGTTEDEMAGWHHWLYGLEFE